MKVADVMTKKVLTIAPDASAADAAWGLTLKGFNGAPVQDEHGHLLGIVSKSDLVDPGTSDVPRRGRTVEDAMTPLLFAIRAADPIMDAVARMLDTGAHRLVVVDAEGRMVGIITPMDVLQALADAKARTGRATLE